MRNELALAAQALSLLCGMLSIFELAVSDLRDFRFGILDCYILKGSGDRSGDRSPLPTTTLGISN